MTQYPRNGTIKEYNNNKNYKITDGNIIRIKNELTLRKLYFKFK